MSDRKWVAVCLNERGKKVLYRFVLPESESWNDVKGEGPNGECLFEDTDEDANAYALCHVMGASDVEPYAFDTVFPSDQIGEQAWANLPELPRSGDMLSAVVVTYAHRRRKA